MSKKDEHIKKELQALFKANALNRAPENFTRRVMQRIQKERMARHDQWIITPLQWIISGVLLIGFWILSFVFQPELPGQFGMMFSEFLHDIELSGTFITCLVVFTVFMGIQVLIIRSKVVQSY